MARPGKKWRITYGGSEEVDTFTSEKRAYEFIGSLAGSYAANPDGMSRYLTVWVMDRDKRDGWDWRPFENLDLAVLVAVHASANVDRERQHQEEIRVLDAGCRPHERNDGTGRG